MYKFKNDQSSQETLNKYLNEYSLYMLSFEKRLVNLIAGDSRPTDILRIQNAYTSSKTICDLLTKAKQTRLLSNEDFQSLQNLVNGDEDMEEFLVMAFVFKRPRSTRKISNENTVPTPTIPAKFESKALPHRDPVVPSEQKFERQLNGRKDSLPTGVLLINQLQFLRNNQKFPRSARAEATPPKHTDSPRPSRRHKSA